MIDEMRAAFHDVPADDIEQTAARTLAKLRSARDQPAFAGFVDWARQIYPRARLAARWFKPEAMMVPGAVAASEARE